MLSNSLSSKEELLDERKVFGDQLAVLLSDNQLFISKVQKAQWNYQVLSDEEYNAVINLLFNCSELIANQLRIQIGHVPANFSVFLEMSNLNEVLDEGSGFEARKDVIESHNILLEFVMQFVNDRFDVFADERSSITSELHQQHTKIYKLIESLNK